MSPYPPPPPPPRTITAGLRPPPPIPPLPPTERPGKRLLPNGDGTYDPEATDIMERLLAMYRPQYVPYQFAQPAVRQITPTLYGFPSTTANVQVFPTGYYETPIAAPLPPSRPPGKIRMEETPEE